MFEFTSDAIYLAILERNMKVLKIQFIFWHLITIDLLKILCKFDNENQDQQEREYVTKRSPFPQIFYRNDIA
jgi:hypothetical protein